MEHVTLHNNALVKNGKRIFQLIDEKILLAGTAGLSKEHLKRTRLVNSMCAITAFLALTIGFLFYVFTGLFKEIFVPAAIEATLFSAVIILNVRKHYNQATVAVLLVHLASAVYFAFILGSLINVPIILAFLFGLCRLIYSDKVHRGISMAAIALALIIIEANAYLEIIKPLDMPESSQWIFRWIALPSFLFFFVMILDYYDIEIKRLYKQIQNFVLKVCHDLRNIINANALQINYLKIELGKKTPDINRMKEFVDGLSSANENMRVIVNNVLDTAGSKINWKTYDETFSLEDLIKNGIETLSASADARGLKITVWYDKEMPEYIISDLGRMNTILNNLLSNAIKYADENTEIKIAVVRNGDHYTVAISNRCPAIPSHKLDRLFDERFTAKNDSNIIGNGLGLYFVKLTVQEFNGSYGVSSNEDETVFYIRLKLIPGKRLDIAEIINNSDACEGAEIFFAEDDLMTNKLVSGYLTSLGCKVTSFTNGFEVIKELEGSLRIPECFLIDDQMPVMSGYRLLQALKSNESPYKSIPVIIITGDALQEAVDRFLEAGAADVIIKPINRLDTIKTKLSQHLPDKAPINAD